MMPLIMITFSLPSFIFLMIGISKSSKKAIIVALWLSLLAMILHYYLAGLEILGNYFNYCHAALYTLNMLVMIGSIIYLLFSSSIRSQKYIWLGLAAPLIIIITEGLLLIANLWVNAYFLEHKKMGTQLIALSNKDKTSYCTSNYIFYKIMPDNTMKYMCPNHYLLIPSIGNVEQVPSDLLPYLNKENSAEHKE